jgi:chromosome segregation ATPase
MTVSRNRNYAGGYTYRCHTDSLDSHMDHPIPSSHNGAKLDMGVWREIVDNGLRNPTLLRQQIEARVEELQSKSDESHNEILRIERRIESIKNERAFFQKKAAQGKISESEFDDRMDETAEQIEFWGNELERLKAYMHETQRVQTSIDYVEELFSKFCNRLEYLDCDSSTLELLSKEERDNILKERQEIIRILVDKVTVNSKREVTIEGVIDGSEGAQFELQGY